MRSLIPVTVYQNNENGTHYIDSDTGLESMSSAETTTTKPCSVCVDGSAMVMNGVGGGGGAVGGVANLNHNNNNMGNIMEGNQVDGLKQEVTRLKCDKLDLLRQNVVRYFEENCTVSISFNPFAFSAALQNCQRDIKRLRERELSLQGDLAAAGKEILRLRDLLKEYLPDVGVGGGGGGVMRSGSPTL